MDIKKFTQEVHENAVAHGWWDENRSFGEVIALCHSELSEALEEYRNGRPAVYCDGIEANAACTQDGCTGTECLKCFVGRKPEGIGVELADCIIRILDYCGKAGIDMEALLELKHEYNKTRPYKHGGKVI